MRWTNLLNSEVSERLGRCKSLKKDLSDLVNAKWAAMKEAGKDKQGFTKEDALVSVLELLDCNGQDFGADLTVDEYNALCR